MTHRTLLLASSAALLFACGPRAATVTTAPASAGSPAATMLGPSYVATLLSTTQSVNRITGKMRLVPTAKAGEMTAEVDIRGGAYQNKYGWVIRSGRCGEQGQDLGTSMSYRVIETRADGMAQVKLPVSVTIPTDRVYHVAVFASPTNRNQIVSCGVLSPE